MKKRKKRKYGTNGKKNQSLPFKNSWSKGNKQYWMKWLSCAILEKYEERRECKKEKRSKLGSILFDWTTSFLVVLALVALILKFMGMPVGATFLSLGNSIPGLSQVLPEATPVHVQAEEAKRC